MVHQGVMEPSEAVADDVLTGLLLDLADLGGHVQAMTVVFSQSGAPKVEETTYFVMLLIWSV